MLSLLALSLLAGAKAQQAEAPFNTASFSPAAASPWSSSTNYTGACNGTIVNSPLVPGRSFDRFIQIWLENTNYADAAASPTFQKLAQEGILLTQSYALTHPSQPNYVAAVSGSFFGMPDDDLYNIPTNISTVIDLLEAKNISWASYQESMPEDGYQGYTYTSADYLTGKGTYTYYLRKHNPTIIHDIVAVDPARRARHRNWNDFAADVNASALPQWLFVTPNIVDDAHDTTTAFADAWLAFWLVPLLNDTRFNDGRTLVQLTFDESETYTINNRVYTVLLGGAVPENLKNTTDSTFYTHYSALTTVEGNWGLGSLGRGDAIKNMSNVFEPFATQWGWENVKVPHSEIPHLNLSGTIGPLNSDQWYTWPAPEFPNATSPGGGPVFIAPGTDMSLTIASLEQHPVNLTAEGLQVPSAGYPPWYSDSTYEEAPARFRVGQVSEERHLPKRGQKVEL